MSFFDNLNPQTSNNTNPDSPMLIDSNASASAKAILDLNSPNFDAEYYVQDLLRRKGLEELVAVEQDMVNNVRRLDSEMQSLVYENYSKFLKATSTVKNMQTRLADTHNEMRDLSTRVSKITQLSDSLTEKFSKNCEKVKRLNEAKDSIKKLEFLIKAPQILQDCISQGQCQKAVEVYIAIKPKLEKFRDIPSIAGIARDAEAIVSELTEQVAAAVTRIHARQFIQLREKLNGRLISSEDVVEAVGLLKRLGDIPDHELESQLLGSWEREIRTELDQLKTSANPAESSGRCFPDIFEFVDIGCCHFLTNLSLMASTFLQLFPKQSSKANLIHLLEEAMQTFEQIVDTRFALEQNGSECALFVKALDRIYRKISVLTRLTSGFNFMRMNAALVQRSAKHQIVVCRQNTAKTVQKTVKEVFSHLSHSPPVQSSSKSDNGGRAAAFSSAYSSPPTSIRHDRKELLKKTLEKLEVSFVHSVKSSLAALLMFTASDIIFSSIPHFSPLFGFDVHQEIVVGAVQDLVADFRVKATDEKMLDGDEEDVVSGGNGGTTTENNDESKGLEMLILCAFLRNLQLKHMDYLMELCQEQYRLSDYNLSEQHRLTTIEEMAQELKNVAETLLRKFVDLESRLFIQMVQKSIDVFDWANCAESPRRVRSLTKHLVQSIDELDKDLAVFMNDGGLAKLKEKTPDSLRGYSTMRRATSAASSVFNDASSVSSGGIVERLWGETVDAVEEGSQQGLAMDNVATMPVDFRRDLLMNAIVRLTLRAMADCVRAQQKFSRQGLEQLQVDCAYMRQKMWASVGDEHMLNMGVEDVLTAAVNQCAQPKLLDPSVVRSICEENF